MVFWEEHVDDHGRVFYYNALTGDSSWEIPVEAAWEARHSKASVARRR